MEHVPLGIEDRSNESIILQSLVAAGCITLLEVRISYNV